MIADLLERCRRGDRLALARLLSLAARGQHLADLDAALPPLSVGTRVVAITGGAGVGKSTLVGKLIETARQEGRTIAVLACDPQSPLSGGALLGDRFRMNPPVDDRVFIRSLAAQGGHAALADHLPLMFRLLATFGFELLLLETVGAGQGDTAVRDLADVVAVLLQPETGDDLQWEKAGVLEVADIIVIHKKDLPGAEQTAAQVRSMLSLSHRPAPPIALVSSKTGEGVAELYRTLSEVPGRERSTGRTRADLLGLLHQDLGRRLDQALNDPNGPASNMFRRWREGTMDATTLVQSMWETLNRH